MNGALSVPTSVPPLYTFTVTVPLAHVDAVIWCARLSGTVHWYTTRPLLLFTDITGVRVVQYLVLAALPVYYGQLSLFSAALFGGLLGFLLYNHYPAKVFMGDTGSLFLGGAVAALAFAYDMPLVLILVGIVYICETLSDILQVGYFKLTHGKRIFKMAPLHHHFEMCGWKETKVVAVFTAVSVIGCVIAYLAVCQRFSF